MSNILNLRYINMLTFSARLDKHFSKVWWRLVVQWNYYDKDFQSAEMAATKLG